MTKNNDLPLFQNQNNRQKSNHVSTPASQEKSPDSEVKVHTVSEINRQVKGLLEGRFALIWLKAEISNFKAHTSGHFYFSLKDEKSQINAVMFRGHNRQLKFKPKDGMEVLIRGRLTVYEPRGNYQVFCETMETVGEGALQQAFENLKRKLKAEGLFEASRKKQLPHLPEHVALVTSPTGAAVRDMLNVLSRRFRGLKITIVPCRVQGDGAAREIVHALEQVERLNKTEKIDAIICGRGGGSLEDLWAFNEEALARKIVDCSIPVISAVGHEIDFTIADFVADLRAPTPSAASELVVKNASEISEKIKLLGRRLVRAQKQKVYDQRQKVGALEKQLVDPKRYLQDLSLRSDELIQRLEGAALRYLKTRATQVSLLASQLTRPDVRLRQEKDRLAQMQARLHREIQQKIQMGRFELQKKNALMDSLSPLKVVERGYSITTDAKKKVIKSAAQLKVKDKIKIKFAKGSAEATVDSLSEES